MEDKDFQELKRAILFKGLTYEQWRELYLMLKLKPNGRRRGDK